MRIFVLQNLIHCITFLLYCSSSSKNLFLCSSSEDSLILLSVLDLEAQWLEKKAGKEATLPQDTHKAGWRWGHPALWGGLSPEMLFKCWQLCALALIGAAGLTFSRVKQATSNLGRCLLNTEV